MEHWVAYRGHCSESGRCGRAELPGRHSRYWCRNEYAAPTAV